jgi:competence protein ComEC
MWIKITPKILFFLFITSILYAFLLYWFYASQPDEKVHIYFLDVGQGDASLIITPHGQTILVDGGPNSEVLVRLGEVLPIYTRTIDLMVLTHPHRDHLDGLVEVLKRYHVRAALITGVIYTDATYQEFLYELKSQKIPTYIADNDEDFLLDQVKLDVLFPLVPEAGQKFTNVNNSSIVFELQYGGNEILYMGDAEQEVEGTLLQFAAWIKTDILKTGHHGSKTASSLDFLNIAKPTLAIISVGADNKYKHPHPETLQKFKELNIPFLRTDEEGTIELTCDWTICSEQ